MRKPLSNCRLRLVPFCRHGSLARPAAGRGGAVASDQSSAAPLFPCLWCCEGVRVSCRPSCVLSPWSCCAPAWVVAVRRQGASLLWGRKPLAEEIRVAKGAGLGARTRWERRLAPPAAAKFLRALRLPLLAIWGGLRVGCRLPLPPCRGRWRGESSGEGPAAS